MTVHRASSSLETLADARQRVFEAEKEVNKTKEERFQIIASILRDSVNFSLLGDSICRAKEILSSLQMKGSEQVRLGEQHCLELEETVKRLESDKRKLERQMNETETEMKEAEQNLLACLESPAINVPFDNRRQFLSLIRQLISSIETVKRSNFATEYDYRTRVDAWQLLIWSATENLQNIRQKKETMDPFYFPSSVDSMQSDDLVQNHELSLAVQRIENRDSENSPKPISLTPPIGVLSDSIPPPGCSPNPMFCETGTISEQTQIDDDQFIKQFFNSEA